MMRTLKLMCCLVVVLGTLSVNAQVKFEDYFMPKTMRLDFPQTISDPRPSPKPFSPPAVGRTIACGNSIAFM